MKYSDIQVTCKKESDKGWHFHVSTGGRNYDVELPRSYWEELTGTHMAPEKLVEKSFEFLLARESPDAILPRFNLKKIQHYFPEFEKEIRKETG